MTCAVGKGALCPVCVGVPCCGALACLEGVGVQNRNVGLLGTQVGGELGDDAHILALACAGQVDGVLAGLEVECLGARNGLAVLRELNGRLNRRLARDLCLVCQGCRCTGDLCPLGRVRTGLDNVLGVKVQPQHQIVALRACCARCIGYRCNLCLGQLALVHTCLRYLTGQHGAVNTAAAVGQQGAGVREADIGGCARPVLDLGIECRCINVAAVVLVLVGIAAGRAVKTADVLHPLALLDASVRVCVVIVPEEFAVVVVKADADRDLTGCTDCHTVQVVGAPADGHALGHERVVIAAIRGQIVDARTLADRQLGPYHTGDAVVDGEILVVGNLDVILISVQNNGAVALVIGADGRCTVQVTVIALARLVDDHGHALDGTLDINGLGCGIADADSELASLLELIGELAGLDLAGLERILLAQGGLVANVQGRRCGAVLVADVGDIGLDVEDIAANVADLTTPQLGADVGIGEGCRTELDFDVLGHVCDLDRVLADLGQGDRTAQLDGLTGLEGLNAVGRYAHRLARSGQAAVALEIAVDVLDRAVVIDRNDSRCHALAGVGDGRGNLNLAVARNRTGLNGNVAVCKLLLVHSGNGRADDAAVCHVLGGQNAVLDGVGHVAALGADRTGILMGQVNGACADGRLIGYRTGVAMGVTGQHHIDVTFLSDRCNVHLGVGVGDRMVHDQNAEGLILVLGQVVLQPLNRLFDLVRSRSVHLAARSLGVHLEQCPRVAVHEVKVYVAVVKGNVARDRRAVLLGLGVDDVHVKVIAEIVVAAGVNHRVIVDKFAAVEPECVLLLLGAGALDHITAVDDESRVIVGNRSVKRRLGVKLMGVGDRDIANLGRVLLQRAEGSATGFAVCQRYLVVIARARGQFGELIPVDIGLYTAVGRCFRVTLDRDRIAQRVGIGAKPNGRRLAAAGLPDCDHAGRLGRQQVRPDHKTGSRVRCERRGNHGQYHNHGQQQAEQAFEMLISCSHAFFHPFSE